MSESFNSRIPNYSNEPDDNNEDISLEADFLLFSERFKNFRKKIEGEIYSKGTEVGEIAKAILRKDFLQRVNRYLGDKLSELMDRSDELIESENANSPEVKELRKVIAEEINQVMDMQDDLRPQLIGIDESNNLIYSSDPEKVKEAQELINLMTKEFDFLMRPNQGLN